MGFGNFMRVSLLAGAVLITACGNNVSENKKQSVNSCSQETIDAFNRIELRTYPNFKRNRSTRSAQWLKASCNSFYSLLGANSCKATITQTGEQIDVAWSIHEQACAEADAYLGSRRSREEQRERRHQQGPSLPSKPFDERNGRLESL